MSDGMYSSTTVIEAPETYPANAPTAFNDIDFRDTALVRALTLRQHDSADDLVKSAQVIEKYLRCGH